MVLNHFANIDLLILVLYFILVMTVGLYASRHKDENSKQYFLAGRNVGWFAIGASLFATNISGEHFVGLAGAGAARGLVVGHFEWLGAFAIIILGWVFVPVYLKMGVFTIPEYLEKRFNRSSRMYLTSVSIVAYILTKLSVTLFAGGILMHALLGWDIYTSTVLMVVLTGIYTIIGGLGAVIYTQVVQFAFLIGGSLILTLVGLNEVGWFSGLKASLPAGHFDIFKPLSDPDFPWTGIVFGAPIIAIWYWCTDQYIVQRLLGAKSISAAKKASIFTGLLKFLPVLLWVVPGMIALALFPEVNGDNAYTVILSSNLLPAGLRGLVFASILAALMSSLASIFNSTSTLYVMDYYKYFHPDASERKLVLVGRLSTMIIVVSAIFWVPLTKIISSNIYIYLQSVQAYIGPPIAAVFLLGIMSKTVNSYGAIWGLIGGGLIGALRFVSELLHNFYDLKNTFFSWFVEINFLHFAVFLFLVSLSIVFIVSKLYGTKVVNGLPQYQTAGIPKLSKQAVSNLELKKQV
jgi:SSS family solute:Na+ symporter